VLCIDVWKQRLLPRVILTDWFLGAFEKFQKRLLASKCLSISPTARNNSAPTGRIFMKCYIWVLLETLSKKSDKNNGCFTWRPIFMIISRSILLRMRNVSDRICRGNKNTHFMFNNYFLKWRRVRECGRYYKPDRTRWRMHMEYCITKATNTHLE
jgi:hypothetical protein